MKLRITAVALSIGLTSTAVPMRSLAISEVTNIEVATQTNDDLITEFIVERLPGRSSLGAMSLIENEFDLEATVESKIFDRLEVIQLDQPVTRAEANVLVQQLVVSGKVALAEINEKRYIATAPNDPDYPNQWHLKDFATPNNLGIGIEAAWSQTTGSPSIVVAVIDTGYTQHPDLPTPLPGYDFFDNDTDATDPGDACNGQPDSWHGTKVAGVIGAKVNNGIGIAGINQQSQIQHIRILGPCGGDVADEIKAIRWAAGLTVAGITTNSTPARVLNLSLGGPGQCSALEQSAINDAVAAGAIVVVAAGNGGDDLDLVANSPANCNNVITVAATTKSGQRANFSNYGSRVTVSAPGDAIRTTTVGGYELVSGTSFATPIVSGIVSLMVSAKPNLTYNQTLATLDEPGVVNPFPAGSRPCSSNIADTNYCGFGIIDAGGAVGAGINITPTGLTTLPPSRIMNTRPTGKIGSVLGTSSATVFNVLGKGGLPNTGISAVLLNVTVVEPEVGNEGGYVTVYPCASGRPDASNLNFTNGQIIPNTVIAPVDPSGNICFYSYGKTHILADVAGWFAKINN
jgi:serine protease